MTEDYVRARKRDASISRGAWLTGDGPKPSEKKPKSKSETIAEARAREFMDSLRSPTNSQVSPQEAPPVPPNFEDEQIRVQGLSSAVAKPENKKHPNT